MTAYFWCSVSQIPFVPKTLGPQGSLKRAHGHMGQGVLPEIALAEAQVLSNFEKSSPSSEPSV